MGHQVVPNDCSGGLIHEGGGRTPVLPPHELYRLGFAMIAYPTTLIFRVAGAIEKALADLKAGRPAVAEGVDFDRFKDITELERWAQVERQVERRVTTPER